MLRKKDLGAFAHNFRTTTIVNIATSIGPRNNLSEERAQEPVEGHGQGKATMPRAPSGSPVAAGTAGWKARILCVFTVLLCGGDPVGFERKKKHSRALAIRHRRDQLMKYHTLAARPHNARPMHDWLGISIRVMYTKVHHLLSMVGTGASPTGAKILASQVVEHERGCVRVRRCGSVVGVI